VHCVPDISNIPEIFAGTIFLDNLSRVIRSNESGWVQMNSVRL